MDKSHPRRRGGQPHNQNARTHGTFSVFQPGPLNLHHLQLRALRSTLRQPSVSPVSTLEQASSLLEDLCNSQTRSVELDLSTIQMVTETCLVTFASRVAVARLHRCQHALEDLAYDPFLWFTAAYLATGIDRDADSFFPQCNKSAFNSPPPASHPHLATNLTDSQWDVLAPLIPPDPHLDWLEGEPPVIIAANRWHFTRYFYRSSAHDSAVMEKYHQILQRCPAIYNSPPPRGRGKG